MAGRRTNLALAGVVALALVTGAGAFAAGGGSGRWVVAAHGAAGLAIVLLAPWKSVVVRRGLRRRHPRPGRAGALALTLAAVLALGFGIAHSTGLARTFGPVTAMQLHVGTALAAAALTLRHMVTRPQRPRRADLGRRALLRLGALAGAAALAWATLEGGLRAAGLPGARRRWTGSYELGTGDPATMPVTQWLDDTVQHLTPHQGTPGAPDPATPSGSRAGTRAGAHAGTRAGAPPAQAPPAPSPSAPAHGRPAPATRAPTPAPPTPTAILPAARAPTAVPPAAPAPAPAAPAPLDGWALVVRSGAGARVWTLAELGRFDDRVVATLDCTGGWWARQAWEGVWLRRLLDGGGPGTAGTMGTTGSGTAAAGAIEVVSVTGYRRRFPVGEAGRLLLATRVGGAPLSPGHGFPARLVAPGRRGFWWVKWVERIEVGARPWWLQPPFPPT